MKIDPNMLILNRRRTLALLGTAGASALLGRLGEQGANAASSFTCATSPTATEGPYWVDEMLNRSDIRTDPTDGSIRPGVPLTLNINVHEVGSAGCGLLSGAHVDIWHCEAAAGLYSDEAANNTVGKKYLRGYQVTDDNGSVQFTTIYPGWYSGRTVHIHVRIRTYNDTQVYDEFTSQVFFDDTITDTVFTQAPYNQRKARDTRNATDMVLQGMANSTQMFLNLTANASGYTASIDIGVNLKTATVSKPAIAAGGVVNAASLNAGIAPGSWITIFGSNLASATHALNSSDLVDGALPTTLSGVSVQINSKPAFVDYVSPTQINLQAPTDDTIGSVPLTATNSNGTSDTFTANLQSILPGLFASSNYVAAVRSDGTIVTGSAVKPGDVLELFGTGFGPTTPAVAAGIVFSGSAPVSNPVTTTIGDLLAPIAYAGLVAAGLYQFNVTVPSLADGDYEVIAKVAGLSTQSGVKLKIQN
jgi:uncharacterized protein (TIGR03437 family)